MKIGVGSILADDMGLRKDVAGIVGFGKHALKR